MDQRKCDYHFKSETNAQSHSRTSPHPNIRILFCTHCFPKDSSNLAELQIEPETRDICCRSTDLVYTTDYANRRFVSFVSPFPQELDVMARRHTLQCLSGEFMVEENPLLVSGQDVGCALYMQFSLHDPHARGSSRQFAIYLLYTKFSQEKTSRLISSSDFVSSNFKQLIHEFKQKSSSAFRKTMMNSAGRKAAKELRSPEEIFGIEMLWRNLHFSFLSIIGKGHFYLLTKYPSEASSFLPPFGSETRIKKEYEPSEEMILETEVKHIIKDRAEQTDVTGLQRIGKGIREFGDLILGDKAPSLLIYSLISGNSVFLMCRDKEFISAFENFCMIIAPPFCMGIKHISRREEFESHMTESFNIFVIEGTKLNYNSKLPYVVVKATREVPDEADEGAKSPNPVRRLILVIEGEASTTKLGTEVEYLLKMGINKGENEKDIVTGLLKATYKRWMALAELWRAFSLKFRSPSDMKRFCSSFELSTADLVVLNYFKKKMRTMQF